MRALAQDLRRRCGAQRDPDGRGVHEESMRLERPSLTEGEAHPDQNFTLASTPKVRASL